MICKDDLDTILSINGRIFRTVNIVATLPSALCKRCQHNILRSTEEAVRGCHYGPGT